MGPDLIDVRVETDMSVEVALEIRMLRVTSKIIELEDQPREAYKSRADLYTHRARRV